MTVVSPRWRPTLAVLTVLALAGCGGDGGAATAGPTRASEPLATSSATVCAADAGSGVALPAGWPAAFPLPEGLVVTAADDRGSGGLVVQGVTSTSFEDVLTGLQQGLPTAGFTPDNGEVEPDDAESDWESAVYEGRWAIRELSQCHGDTAVSLLARRKAG